MYNIAIAQSGGPTVAINSSLVGVFKKALNSTQVLKIYGSLNGIDGILNEKIIELTKFIRTEDDCEILKRTPSTILGSCRVKLPDYAIDKAPYEKIAEVFDKYEISCFFYIGGNDSMDTVLKLDNYFKSIEKDIRVIGIPKTIDNDLPVTDHTPGFGSAAKYVCTSLCEIIKDSEVYELDSVTIVEIMGRHAGWLTASTCLLHDMGEVAPHLIYLPETKFSLNQFFEDIKEVQKEHKAVIIAISEGVEIDDSGYQESGCTSQLTDAFGHRYLSGVGKYLERAISDKLKIKVRSIELNVLQRCSSHLASLTDIEEAEQIGSEAVTCALNGESGKVVIFKRVSNSPYTIEFESADVSDIANKEKPFPLEWINKSGNNVKSDAVEYFKPLIQGELDVVIKDGLPQHFKLIKEV